MFRKAEKRKAKLRLAITGPAGSGKTYGALLIALGLGGQIALIDTENGSGDLYADLCDYDVANISAPYKIEKYINSIHEAESAGYNVLIIDSLSHAWSGEGGLLDVHSKMGGNSYAAWGKVTPLHNKLIETMLASKCHIIATMRTKTEYSMIQNASGKTEIKKIGLAPIQREGMDYEFTVMFNLNMDHTVTVTKDRTRLFDRKNFVISQETGRILNNWLNKGSDSAINRNDFKNTISRLYHEYLILFNNDSSAAQEVMQSITNNKPSREWTQEDIKNLTQDLNDRLRVKN